MRDSKPEIIPNRDGAIMTPSAIFIDKKGQLHVGRVAKERNESDSGNCRIEFKLKMGQGGSEVFEASGRRLLPEEMSAEVLKCLKQDVFQMHHDEVQSAVITVPADFDRPAIEADNEGGHPPGL